MRAGAVSRWFAWLGPPHGLVFLTAVVVASFVGTILYGARIASAIDGMAYDIGENAAPSVQELSAARTELFTMASALAGAFVDPGRRPEVRRTIEAAHARLHQDLDAYLRLPFFPGEHVRFAATSKAIDDAEVAIGHVADRLQGGDIAGAESVRYLEMAEAMGRADVALQDSVMFDAVAGERLSDSIRDLRKRAQRALWGFGLVDVLLAASLMEIARRASRQHLRLRDLRDAAEREMSGKLRATVQATVDIARKISESAQLAAVAQEIADEARSVLRADYGALGLGTDPEQPFDVWVASGMDPRARETIGRVPRPVGVLGAVARRGECLRLEEVASSPDFGGLPPHHPDVGPFLGVPIRHQGRTVGDLYLARKPRAPGFSEQDERVATLFAAYAGVALQNSGLNAALHRAVEAREDLLAVVSHDLRNPLHAIKLAADMLATADEKGISGPDRARVVEGVRRSARRMSRLIEDLLTAAKADVARLSVELRPESAAAMVEESLRELDAAAEEKSVALEARVPDDLPPACCDRGRILQVLANLIGNALKFTPNGGRISVGVRREGDFLWFSVADTGPGIGPAHLPHVFERYWQKSEDRRRGTGLGLYIVKAIVESHGGNVSVESEVGRGATFSFTIPVGQPSPARAGPEIASSMS